MLSSRPVQFDLDGPSMAKTPGRALLKGRTALQENAYGHQGSAFTTNHKAAGQKSAPKTPFHPNTLRKKLYYYQVLILLTLTRTTTFI